MSSFDDRSSSFPPPAMPVDHSEATPARTDNPGYGLAPNDHATPAAKRAGYGYAAAPGGGGSAGSSQDASNQYTTKLPRGSSL